MFSIFFLKKNILRGSYDPEISMGYTFVSMMLPLIAILLLNEVDIKK